MEQSTTTVSSKAFPRTRSTAGCARRRPSAGAKPSRASPRSTSRRRRGRTSRTPTSQRHHVHRARGVAALPPPARGSRLRSEWPSAARRPGGAADRRQRRRPAVERRREGADGAGPGAPTTGRCCSRSWRAAGQAVRCRSAEGMHRWWTRCGAAAVRAQHARGGASRPSHRSLLATGGIFERLLKGLPEGIAVPPDEAVVIFADAQPTDASLKLFCRSIRGCWCSAASPSWAGGALALRGVAEAPGRKPPRGVLELDPRRQPKSRRRARWEALRSGAQATHASRAERLREQVPVADRRAARARLRGDRQPEANFLWVAHPKLDGTELATRMERAGVLVATGAGLDEPAAPASRCATPSPPAGC